MRSVPTAVLRALGAVLARPGQLVALLLVNLLTALVLVVPLSTLASRELDPTLYSEEMVDGLSWRWLDTAGRRHPHLLGGVDFLESLLGADGIGFDDLATLSGVPAAVVLAGLVLFWLHALLHCGFLSTLGGGRRSRGMLAGAARLAVPATLLAALAAAGYALAYAVLYHGTGGVLEPVVDRLDREPAALALLWARAALTLLGLLAVKLWFDLAKTILVASGGWNFAGAALRAAGELLRRGGRYLAAYLLVGVGSLALVALWWWLAGALAAGTTAGLLVLLVARQLFVAARVGLRLTHLGATWNLYGGQQGSRP